MAEFFLLKRCRYGFHGNVAIVAPREFLGKASIKR